MKKWVLFLLVIFSVSFYCVYESGYSNRDFQNYPIRTIGHQFLDIEKQNGIVFHDSVYQVLDRMLHIADTTIKIKKFGFRRYALGVLKIIDSLIIREGYVYRNNLLLSKGLESKEIDCDNYVILYLSIGEYLNFPIFAKNVPGHLFVTWDNYINWETIGGFEFDAYFFLKNMDSDLVIRKIYLSKLTEEKLYAFQFENIGLHYYNKKKFFRAIENYHKAIEYFPHQPSFYNNLGNSFAGLRIYDEAFKSYQQAIKVNSQNPHFYNNLGNLFLRTDSLDKAIHYYKRAISLKKNHPDFYNNLAIAQYRLKRYQAALENLQTAIGLNPNIADYYNNMAVVYYLMKNNQLGDRYYEKAQEILKKNLEKNK